MYTKYLILSLLFIILINCRKPVDSEDATNSDFKLECYENYSNSNFDYIQQHLIGQSPFGATFETINTFTFFEPVFNIADMAISSGVGMLLIFNKKAFPKEKSSEKVTL